MSSTPGANSAVPHALEMQQQSPPFLLSMAARAALRTEFVGSNLVSVPSFHGEVLVPAAHSAVFTLPDSTGFSESGRKPFRSWTALVLDPSFSLKIQCETMWTMASRVLTLVSDAQCALEVRVVNAMSPISPSDIRTLLRFMCSRNIFERKHQIHGALSNSVGLFTPLATSQTLRSKLKAAALNAIVPFHDVSMRESLEPFDCDVLVQAAVETWYKASTPLFCPETASKDVFSSNVLLSHAAKLDSARSALLSELEASPCDLLELPEVITSYSLSPEAFRNTYQLAVDLGVIE